MESPEISRYIHQKSKKRVFMGSSSSCVEPEVIEISPPLDHQSSKSKAKGKQKQAVMHEIIDVDMDEDRNDVVFLDGKVESNKKSKLGKDTAIMSSSNSIPTGSNNFFDLDDYVFDDDYLTLQSHFDNMDLPTGIEAPIPFLPDLVQMKKKTIANPLVNSPAQLAASHPNKVDPTSTWQSGPTKNASVSSVETPHKIQHQKVSLMYANDQLGSSNGSYPSFIQFPVDTNDPFGLEEWHKSIMMNHQELNDDYSSVMGDMFVGPVGPDVGNSTRSSSLVGSSSSMAKLDKEDVLKRYESFKKFDTVVDFSDHLYSAQSSSMKHPPKNWAKKIQEEWKILEKDLPDTIFVRVYESRMDLLRAVIIGAEGTPYHDGLFFFDVCFPSSYPNSPPLVRYHSGGLRINPNLYNCGKVCLSLLNTWTGGQKERWIPGTSTMLQVLVSIQGLILNMKPYFNEPGYANLSGSVQGEQKSIQYNENTLILSLKTMVYTMRKQPKNFEDLVVGHFRNRVRDILMACKAYTEGVQVGCIVKGGVQDVDEGNKSCSTKFKNDVASYIKTLVGEFKKIGAKEAEEFLHLSKKKSPLPPPPPTPLPLPPAAAAPAHIIGYPPFPPYNVIPAYNNHW